MVTYEPTGDGSLDDVSGPSGCVLPFAAFTLTAGGESHPVVDKHSEMAEFETEKVVVFEVPANLTAATLVVAAAQPVNCASAGNDHPYRATAEATLEITLPED